MFRDELTRSTYCEFDDANMLRCAITCSFANSAAWVFCNEKQEVMNFAFQTINTRNNYESWIFGRGSLLLRPAGYGGSLWVVGNTISGTSVGSTGCSFYNERLFPARSLVFYVCSNIYSALVVVKNRNAFALLVNIFLALQHLTAHRKGKIPSKCTKLNTTMAVGKVEVKLNVVFHLELQHILVPN